MRRDKVARSSSFFVRVVSKILCRPARVVRKAKCARDVLRGPEASTGGRASARVSHGWDVRRTAAIGSAGAVRPRSMRALPYWGGPGLRRRSGRRARGRRPNSIGAGFRRTGQETHCPHPGRGRARPTQGPEADTRADATGPATSSASTTPVIAPGASGRSAPVRRRYRADRRALRRRPVSQC